MFVLNPCSFFKENQPIPFHRNFTVFLIIFDLSLLILLRLLSIFFRSGHKQRIDDIVRRNVKKEVIKVEEIKVDLREQTGMVLKERSPNKQAGVPTPNPRLVKEKKAKEASQNSSQSQSSDSNRQEELQKEKYVIELRKLKMTQSEFINTYTISLGFRFLSLGLTMMYYPFALVSLVSLTQTLLKTMSLILRICGFQGKMITILQGIAFFLNLIILGFAIYGLETRIPKNDGHSCYDL